jgi:SAM-dependent methyltransferase
VSNDLREQFADVLALGPRKCEGADRAKLDVLCRQIDVRKRLDGDAAVAGELIAILLANASDPVPDDGGNDGWALKCTNSVLKALDLRDDIPGSGQLRVQAMDFLDRNTGAVAEPIDAPLRVDGANGPASPANRVLPLTVLAWEGPQARAYLVRMRRAGIRPARIVLMVRDTKAESAGRPASLGSLAIRRAERAQDRSHNFHPYAIRKEHPELVGACADAMAAIVDDPARFYEEMYEGFSYDDFTDSIERVGANNHKDPGLLAALTRHAGETVIYTGGGIIPAPVFEIPGLRVIHVHTGFLPHVRGADVLLWSLLVRGRPGVSAFFMTAGLDEGDVLAAREAEPLVVNLPAGASFDDDTLYRALFSFIDPLIRAELLVADVLGAATDVDALAGTPQRLDVGVTYHFMHPTVRGRALRALFDASDASEGSGRSTSESGSPERYQKFYERFSARAPMRFAMDAARADSSLRARSIRNRQKDYARFSKRPDLLVVHREMNRQLALQSAEWDSYDYGEGYFYQSSDELGITGLRDTTGRVEAFGLRELLANRSVLEIGCNTGFLTLAVAPIAKRVVGFELNPYLIAIARIGAKFLGAGNVEFDVAAFEEFRTDETFDDVVSFANHHTYDGNTRQSLEAYFERCHALTSPGGGRLIFESHPPELEGADFDKTVAIIDRFYEVECTEVHEYGTFLDANRRFIVGTRRD